MTAREPTQVSVGRIKNVVPGLTSATAKGDLEKYCRPRVELEKCFSLNVRAAAAKRRSFLRVYFAGALMILKYLTSGSRQAASSLGAPRVAARRRRRREEREQPGRQGGLAGPGRG